MLKINLTIHLVCIYFISLFISLPVSAAEGKFALVIGNSKYEQLGTLSNTVNDAKDIEKSFKEMGYETTLLIDGNESNIRKSLRSFAVKSNGASIAVVFYAGHGAQVGGENYLLPTDMDVPQRESDIRLSGLKVDDVINSLQSKTKVIFLDACRDNPALMKNLSAGRGNYRGGLAPANSSNIETNSGGVFIAYATDAGNVALDGDGQKNSPFTQALLKNIKQPISIDDMFSLVTKEVRLKTKNSQKPYKYASLEGVVCLTGTCGTNLIEISTNKDELATAARALEEVNKNKVNKVDTAIEWVLIGFQEGTHELVYLDFNSIKKLGNRVQVRAKWEKESSLSTKKSNDQTAYIIRHVIDECGRKKGMNFQVQEYDHNGKLLKDISLGNPEFMKITFDIDPKSIGDSIYTILCDTNNHNPLVPAKDLESNIWSRLYTTDIEKSVDFYYLKTSVKKTDGHVDLIVKFKYQNLHNLNEVYPALGKIKDWPKIKNTVIQDRFECEKNTFYVLRQNYFDEDGKWILDDVSQLIEKTESSEVKEATPFYDFFKFICAFN